jgi:hypothetical protein
VAEPDLGYELLEARPVGRRGARQAEIDVDDDDTLIGPAERHGALPQGVLALGALHVLEDLSNCGLPDVEVGVSTQVACADLLVGFAVHVRASLAAARAMLARTRTRAAWR